jgi:hypothetical protein
MLGCYFSDRSIVSQLMILTDDDVMLYIDIASVSYAAYYIYRWFASE